MSNLNIYLVKGQVEETQYMGKMKSFTDIRLVKAENESEALTKYENYWHNKTSEYSVYYSAYGEVQETVE